MPTVPFDFRRRHLLLAAAAAAGGRAFAQAGFPSRPVSLIVPYTAGGASDVGARLLAAEMARALGGTVVIDNVAGASGAIGMQKLARAPADGHTLVYAGLSEGLLVPQINPAAGYRPEELTPLGLAGSSPVALVARPDLPADSVDALVALLRRNPGRYSFGSAGIGSFAHVMGEAIKERTGTFLVHIPYRGGSQIMTDLVSGQIDLAITTVSNASTMAAGRRVRMLAVSSRERIPAFRDVPTFAESVALKGLEMNVWAVVFAPPGLPEPVAARLNAAIVAAQAVPAVREAIAKLGAEVPAPLSLAQTRAFLAAQDALYRPVTRRIKPE